MLAEPYGCPQVGQPLSRCTCVPGLKGKKLWGETGYIRFVSPGPETIQIAPDNSKHSWYSQVLPQVLVGFPRSLTHLLWLVGCVKCAEREEEFNSA